MISAIQAIRGFDMAAISRICIRLRPFTPAIGRRRRYHDRKTRGDRYADWIKVTLTADEEYVVHMRGASTEDGRKLST